MTTTTTDLRDLLTRALPVFHHRGTSLNIDGLASNLGMSRGGVYKWFKANRISPKGVRKILDLAANPENRRLLAETGTHPPAKEDFTPFLV